MNLPAVTQRYLLGLHRREKKFIVVIVDAITCAFALWLAICLRLGEIVFYFQNFHIALILSIALCVPIFFAFGLYSVVFRYSGSAALNSISHASGLYGLIYACYFALVGIPGVPRTIGVIQPTLLLLFVAGSRMVASKLLRHNYEKIKEPPSKKLALIYGAGRTGQKLHALLSNNPEFKVTGFLDDDRSLHQHKINGLKVYDPKILASLVSEKNIKIVVLAIPGASRQQRRSIIENIRTLRLTLRTVSDSVQGLEGYTDAFWVRELEVDDLLGREIIDPDPSLMSVRIHQRKVVISGAGGSIGSELCRQVMRFRPSKLILIEQNEFSLHSIFSELKPISEKYGLEVIPMLVSICDRDKIFEIFATWRPDTIFHAAAYKHVPLVEHNPCEGLRNNVFGTLVLARLSFEMMVSDFVLVSTDKAVRPTNIMGASKRLAELILQALAGESGKTRFSIVRFGNVLASSGSVVPIFRSQIANGGPVTLTHPEVTRYFMAIPEAAQLVIQAAGMANGGEVFILDMGNPVKIMDLARQMIELSGFTVKDQDNLNGDIAIEIVGLRPGEKLHEELLIAGTSLNTNHPKIRKVHERSIPWRLLSTELDALDESIRKRNLSSVIDILRNLVEGYVPHEAIVDWVFMERQKKVTH